MINLLTLPLQLQCFLTINPIFDWLELHCVNIEYLLDEKQHIKYKK